MLVSFAPVSAAEAEKAEGFDLQSVLWGHVKDSYEWHITDIGEKKIISIAYSVS